MTDILKTIITAKRQEIAAKAALGLYDTIIESAAACTHEVISMSRALAASQSGIIAEFKRRSPSKGDIHPAADVASVVPAYENSEAAACSILTDTRFFGGSLNDLALARSLTRLPLLRKDFIIDERQIFEARAFGADAVLLIAAALSFDEICRFTNTAHSLGLEVLLELHDESELDRLVATVDMVGINNRNLSTFATDTKASVRMASSLPDSMVKVAESGITDMKEVSHLRKAGYRGFLIGETFMKHDNPGHALKSFINEH